DLRKKYGEAKSLLEKQTFHLGGLSIRLTSTLVYLCCLLCAIFIWINVDQSNAESSVRRFDNINVVIEGEAALLRNDLTVFELIDKTVSVTVEGAKSKVDALSDENIVAYVDVSEVSEAGNVRLTVSLRGVGKLDYAVSPSSVKTFIDERVEVDVPISVMPASYVSDYEFDLRANLDSVAVSGAKSIVEKVKEAHATPSLGTLVTSTTASTPLKLVDENGNTVDSPYITSSVHNVVVNVDVFAEKTVPLTYAFKHGYIKDKNIKVTLSPSEITLRGDPAVINDISSFPIVTIDETKLTKNKPLTVRPSLPKGVVDVNETEGFYVDIELVNCVEVKIEIPLEDISVSNPMNYSFSFKDGKYELSCIVDSASVKKIKSQNFDVEIDFSGAVVNSDGYCEIMPSVSVIDTGFTLYPINIGKIKADVIMNK
ncbi:MAG: hypothetical protein IJ303_01805, partial [Clostridia bacterium]|nr:hypothetical protein [Clostridia bacterium]